MLFNLIKKWDKVVVYEFNISFALIFYEWKMVLSNLTLGIPNKFLFAISNTFIYITLFHILSENQVNFKWISKLKASAL